MVVETERIAAMRLLIGRLELALSAADDAAQTLIGAWLSDCLIRARATLEAMRDGTDPG